MKRWTCRVTICFLAAFSGGTAIQAKDLNVVATFSIIGDFAAQVGGDRIALRVLVGPDSDAHVHESRPSDAIALAEADVILSNGLGYEGFMDRLITTSKTNATIVTLTDGIPLLEEAGHHRSDGEPNRHAETYDPHAWQSVPNAKIYVGNIAAAFCAADVDGCAEYRENADRYLARLDELDAAIRASIAALPENRRTVIVAHNAFRYFEGCYGIHFLSPQGVSTDSEAAAADVAGLIREIRDHDAKAILAENVNDTRLLKRIAHEAGLKLTGTLYSDALSAPDGPAPDYISMMRHNSDTIASALSDR